ADLGGVHSRHDVTFFGVLLRPPLEQHREAMFFWLDAPVKLRCKIIDPAILKPASGVGIEFGVSIIGFMIDGGGNSGTPNAEGAYAELYPRFGASNRLINSFNKIVDVVAAPIIAAQAASAPQFFPTRFVGEIKVMPRAVLFFVRIKIIVEMNAIYI